MVECSDCHSLYHQECHQPAISESDANDQENSWYCSSCKSKNISKASSTNSSPAKSTSSSSSSYTKNYESSSSSSKKSKDKAGNSTSTVPQTSTGSNSGNSTPTINIVTADKRLQSMKKKAAAQRKHK